MSCYVLDDKQINVLVKAFEVYNVEYHAYNYKKPVGFIIDLQELRNEIGKSLKNINIESYNYRYKEDSGYMEKYCYEDVEINPGLVYDCIHRYEYNFSEDPDYFESEVHDSFKQLKDKMLLQLIRKCGYKCDRYL